MDGSVQGVHVTGVAAGARGFRVRIDSDTEGSGLEGRRRAVDSPAGSFSVTRVRVVSDWRRQPEPRVYGACTGTSVGAGGGLFPGRVTGGAADRPRD